MSKIQLYSAKACPYAHRTRLVLGEKGIDFEYTEIDLQNKPEWFSTISKYGKVPALRHGENEVYESVIINEYLNDVFPEPALLPKDAGSRAIARIWIDYANTKFTAGFGKLLRGKTSEEHDQGRVELNEAILFIENEALAKRSDEGDYWFGENISLVDLTFYPWFERIPTLSHYRNYTVPTEAVRVKRWWDAVSDRPAVKAIANPVDFYIERYSRFIQQPVAA